MTIEEPLRVLIVEDEALVAIEIESLLEENGHVVVGWATTFAEARQLVARVLREHYLPDAN